MTKRFHILFLSITVVFSAHAQPALRQFTNNPALRHASVGVQVTDLKTGKTVASHDSQKSLTPASITKIITTATALELLGGDYRYSTHVALDEDNPERILVIGSGDPTLGSEAFGNNAYDFFEKSAEALKKALDPEKIFSIYVVDNLFGYNGISPEWTWIDMGNYYAAGAYGISVFDNSYKLVFNTMNRLSAPEILRTEPEIKGLTFVNELTLNTSGSDNGYIYGTPFSYDRSVRGNIPAGRSEFSIKGDIPDPGMLLGETLANYLRNAGINISKVETAHMDYISKNKTPCKVGKIIHAQASPPLKDIVREVNVKSNNHFAEHLIRTIGRSQNGDAYNDALQGGIDFIHKFWTQEGVSTTSLTLYDGSGLAPQNAFCAAMLTDILYVMYNNSKESKQFIASLPIAGKEGTLAYFMKNTKYEGKIIAKSGSIGGVHCYSGYLLDGEKQYAFTVMVNKFNGTRPQVRSAIEKFLQSL